MSFPFSLPEEELKAYRIDRNKLNFGDKVVIAGKEDVKNVVTLVAVGYPVNNCEVRVCDKNNKKLPDFYVGCLQVRGENVIKSYYNNEKATKESFVGDGWFDTGDLCFRDKKTIVITGREKEIIFISGQNYYPYDIERIEKSITINHQVKSEMSQKEEIQNILLKIWKETLSDDNIGINDNFFDLGGSSTMLIVLSSKIEKVYKNYLSAIDFFEAPTITEQAELIFKEQSGERTLLENSFPEGFYSFSESTAEPDYALLVQNLEKYKEITSGSDDDANKLVMMVNLYMLGKILINNEVNLNVLSKDGKSFIFINIDVNMFSSFEQLADELEKRLGELESSIDAKNIERHTKARTG